MYTNPNYAWNPLWRSILILLCIHSSDMQSCTKICCKLKEFVEKCSFREKRMLFPKFFCPIVFLPYKKPFVYTLDFIHVPWSCQKMQYFDHDLYCKQLEHEISVANRQKNPRLWYLAVFGTFSKWISPFDGRLDKTGKKNYRTLFQMFWMWNKSFNSLDGELLNYLFSNILPNFWLLAV